MVRQLLEQAGTDSVEQHREPPDDRTEPASSPRASTPVFVKADWTSFRTMDGLCRRAGVPQHKLAELVVKELVDNAVDAAGDCELSIKDGVVVVHDRGPGIAGDDDEIAHWFSISRPLISSKHLRLPTRGRWAMACELELVRLWQQVGGCSSPPWGRLEIVTDYATGRSRAIHAGPYDGPGTRIEISLGRPLELDAADLNWAEIAIAAARAQKVKYDRKTSPRWYDTESFHELLLSMKSQDTTVREFLTNFDGCSAKAGEIAGEFRGRTVSSLSRGSWSTLVEGENVRTGSQSHTSRRVGRRRFLRSLREVHRLYGDAPMLGRNSSRDARSHRGMGRS